MKNKLFIAIALISVFLVSCSKNKEPLSKSTNLDAFSEIAFNSPFHIYLTEDSCYSIKIIAHKSIIDNITYSIADSVLTIRNNSKLKWLKPTQNKVSIYIHSKPLRKIELNETSYLQTLNPITSESFGLILRSKTNEANLELNCGSFYYWNDFPCGGKLTLKGISKRLKLWNFAILSVDAQKLITKEALVENHSQGNCTVNVADKLTYSIYNSGNIILYGNPKEIIENELESSGNLILK
jgi:hypothetical protein